MSAMRVVKGKVVGNTVVLEGEALPEGSAVDVVLHESGDADFVLTEEMRRELREASAAVRRGEVVDMDDVLAEVDAL